MRILYGHDYYDNALAFGRDETILFLREKERFLTDKEVPYVQSSALKHTFWLREAGGDYIIPDKNDSHFVVNRTQFFLRQVVVVFCGKIFTGIRVDIVDPKTYATEPIFFWMVEAFEEWLHNMKLEMIERRWMRFRIGRGDRKDVLIEPYIYFRDQDAPRSLMDWLVSNKVVIVSREFTLGQVYCFNHESNRNIPTWRVNGDNLKDVQFFKKIDSYTAFQEISMWIGGVLPAPGNPMAQVADSVRIEKHGFDKASFRNMERK